MDKKMAAFRMEVISMERQLNSYFEAPEDSKARSIVNSFKDLENEIQIGKTGDTIQNKLKEIERQLKPAFDDNVMNYNHFNQLESWVRGHLNNYQ
jgi:hypothetical protein